LRLPFVAWIRVLGKHSNCIYFLLCSIGNVLAYRNPACGPAREKFDGGDLGTCERNPTTKKGDTFSVRQGNAT